MTCDNTTDICPGTKLTCNCSVSSTSAGVIWTLPGSETIALDDKVGSNSTILLMVYSLLLLLIILEESWSPC